MHFFFTYHHFINTYFVQALNTYLHALTAVVSQEGVLVQFVVIIKWLLHKNICLQIENVGEPFESDRLKNACREFVLYSCNCYLL